MASDGAFTAGTLLGGRFELHGVVGRGGTGTVVLATDRLRSERVALKIVHPHLAADPATRRRLQREVQSASVLHSDAALVPNDLHETDGVLALSMPFHPGQTLTERIATSGPMTHPDVRALGIRIGTALAEAHRVGLLHRDVTANNVLVGDRPNDAVLTDFGLSRIVGHTRSTALLGTAGYAAPEVYAGERADPRSDLYGLGAVLYLAVTGRPPFDPDTPMVALKQQIDESHPKVRALRPDCPADLADTIERLLRADPADRPQGARDVVDALERREATGADPRPVARGASFELGGQYLPPGTFTVWVRERSEDRRRRERLRRLSQGAVPSTEDEIARWGRHLVGRVRDALGVPPPESASPEDRLLHAVADEAGVPPAALLPSPVLLSSRFRLVDATDRATASRLADSAKTLGFRAEIVPIDIRAISMRQVWTWYTVAVTLGWSLLPFLQPHLGYGYFATVFAITVGVPLLAQQLETRRPPGLDSAGIAFRADLRGALRSGVAPVPRFSTESAPVAAPSVAPTSGAPERRSVVLKRRADQALDALDATAASIDLPDVARSDLRSTARALREQAKALAADIDRIEPALEAHPDDGQIATLRSRLDRLDTLARAGEAANSAERERLRRALGEHEANQEAAERLEAQLAACTAHLLEIASTASRVRRELLLDLEQGAAAELVKQLQQESRAVVDARREAGRRAAVARER